MAEVRHVILAKPGDILLIGNLGNCLELGGEDLQRIGQVFRDQLGIEVVGFEADIDMNVVSGGSG
jgi:hypothetical protein